jgi:outer membrane protein OmpA-like peptidoglycan-associated protein
LAWRGDAREATLPADETRMSRIRVVGNAALGAAAQHTASHERPARMSANGPDDQRFVELRSLLLGEDFRRLDEVTARVEKIDAHVGDAKRLETATAEVLVEAFRKAEVAHHRELTSAVAPLVVSAIRSEIKNSKEMMVEALYPITGRLVTAAVAGAFRDLVEQLNGRIDSLMSANVWRLRMRALMTGRSMAEVAMAESGVANLKQALLLERGSGRVLANWPPTAQEGDRTELASGLIAAITEFAATVYANSGGELRMLDLGSSHVFLRASARVIVAAEFSGELSGSRERRLDEAFLTIVERHEQDEDGFSAQMLDDALETALSDEPAKPASKKPIIVAATLAAALALWAAWEPATRAWREHRIRGAFDAAMAAHGALKEFPLRLEVDHERGRVILRGLTADEAEPQAIVEAIERDAKPYRTERDVKVVVLAPQAADLQADGARSGAHLAEMRVALDRLRAEADAPAAKLRRFIDGFAVFFTEQDTIVDRPAVIAGLDELAALLKATNEGLRVVGYADESGSPASNRAASRKRADKIVSMLVQRGVAREKLALVPRSTFDPIADTGLDAVRSRRVVFERPYAREFDQR